MFITMPSPYSHKLQTFFSITKKRVNVQFQHSQDLILGQSYCGL